MYSAFKFGAALFCCDADTLINQGSKGTHHKIMLQANIKIFELLCSL
jgi:hypothetical protein